MSLRFGLGRFTTADQLRSRGRRAYVRIAFTARDSERGSLGHTAPLPPGRLGAQTPPRLTVHHRAGLRGSSHYDLPGVLRWMTANIGVHHVHHLSSGIPFYRLRDVLRDHPELDASDRAHGLGAFSPRWTLQTAPGRRTSSDRTPSTAA